MARTCPPPAVYRAGSVLPALPPLETPRVGEAHQGHISTIPIISLPQVPLVFPIIYIICSVLVTIVPMVASPWETGYGCAIIATGVPVYFIFVSEDLITKPACVHKFLGLFLRLTILQCNTCTSFVMMISHYVLTPPSPDSCTSFLQKVFVAVTPQHKLE